MKKAQPLVYSKKLELLGYLLEYSYKNQSVTFETEEDAKEHTTTFDDVVIMETFGEAPDGTPLYDGDVFESKVSGNLYEAEMVEAGFLQFHLLDDDLNRLHEVDKYTIATFLKMLNQANTYEIIGNKYELEDEDESMDFDFTVKVVRGKSKNGDKFFYACNDRDNGYIDLIDVVFVGSSLFEGDYQRVTYTYPEFELLMLNTDVLEFVDPRELQSYAMKMMSGKSYSPCGDCDCRTDEECTEMEAPKDFSEEEADTDEDSCDCFERNPPSDEEGFCNECDHPDSKCECELWKKGNK